MIEILIGPVIQMKLGHIDTTVSRKVPVCCVMVRVSCKRHCEEIMVTVRVRVFSP